MKQRFTRKIKWLLPMLLVTFSISISIAQIKTADAKTQSHEIIISISGIAYEDANLSSVKESLKKNPNVKSIKPTYAQETAKITVTYVGSSGELLDEIPENIKQFFKLTTLNDNSIAFAYKNSLQKTDSVVTKVSTAVTSNDTDCKSCERKSRVEVKIFFSVITVKTANRAQLFF